ncbi:MAG: hypothetical protein Q4C67_06585 [Deinococcus sp.]|nr:hypothetical protein [Deinococcus sp.]
MSLSTYWPDGRPKVWTTDPKQAEVYDYGGAPVATHNLLCPKCDQRPAVYDLSGGVFEPCGSCAKPPLPRLLSLLRRWKGHQ